MLGECFENVRRKCPVIHNITNYVTVNDVANITLACGASPIMADEPDEAEEITSVCSGLNINIGTLNKRTIPAMLLSGKKANELLHPCVLDPVGAGASRLRTDTALELIKSVKFSVIRGNISEIKALALGNTAARGVDADEADKVTSVNLDAAADMAMDFSAKTGAVISISGETDIIADKNRVCFVRNGCAEMSTVTGTGCMLSALTAAFAAANPDNIFEAAVSAVCAMGLCGETARSRLTEQDGCGSYRNYIIDAISRLTPEALENGAKYEMR